MQSLYATERTELWSASHGPFRDPLSEFGLDTNDFDLYNHESIARITGKRLLKFYPVSPGDIDPNYMSEVEQLITRTKLHLGKLAGYGMNIVPVDDSDRFVGLHPAGYGLAVFTIAPEVDGICLDIMGKGAIDPDQLAEQVVDPLTAYYEWILSSSSVDFLHDLPQASQYVYGTLPDAPNDEKRFWLVDLEPRVRLVSGSGCSLRSDLGEFENMLFEVTHRPEDASDKLTDILELVECI